MSHQHNYLNNNVEEYKGLFFNDNKDKDYHEAGAHFSYRELFQKLKELTRTLSPDRIMKPEVHQKTKSYTIEKIDLRLKNKNTSTIQIKEYNSIDKKKENLKKKKKKLMLQTITNPKEEGLPSISTINTEILQLKLANQTKTKVKLKIIPFNKDVKQFPMIKKTKEEISSRNKIKVGILKNNTLINPYLSIDSIGRQKTERKLQKITHKGKKLKKI